MRQLNFELNRMLRAEQRTRSFGTMAARGRILAQCANELHELGYRNLTAKGLKTKHVDALVNHWLKRDLTPGTIKNRMTHVRWWANQIGKPGVVRRDNATYGIATRQYVTNIDKSRQLDEQRLSKVQDQFVQISLLLQQAFGLRREEAIKFIPAFADRGDKLTLKGSWTKGGKVRDIPIRTDQQREVLRLAHQIAGKGALIPGDKLYVEQLKIYERHTSRAGFNKLHGLRHGYAQQRYQELTGWACPVQGGPRRAELKGWQQQKDVEARLLLSSELGHERLAVVSVYLGS